MTTSWQVKSIQVAMPHLETREDREWMTGIFKTPVTQAIQVGTLGLVGDGVGDTVNHGGPDKAVCCHPWAHYEYWNAYFEWNLQAGAFGENLTLTELSESDVAVGDIWQIGTTRFQISQPRIPCWKQGDKLKQKGFEKLTLQTGRSGFYLRVLEEGTIAPNDTITLLDRPTPEATIVLLNRAMLENNNLTLAERFVQLPFLSDSWREMFIKRLS